MEIERESIGYRVAGSIGRLRCARSANLLWLSALPFPFLFLLRMSHLLRLSICVSRSLRFSLEVSPPFLFCKTHFPRESDGEMETCRGRVEVVIHVNKENLNLHFIWRGTPVGTGRLKAWRN